MSKIQIRINEEIKNSAKEILNDLGLNMTTARTVYLKQIINHKSIPCPLVTENGLTPTQENTILKAAAQATEGINITKQMSVKESVEYLNKM